MNKPAVHLTLQGKGGVGKSFVSSLVAQYLESKGQTISCIDTDPVNATFEGYAALKARRIELIEEGNVLNQRKFDEMMELILTQPGTFVVDNGASSYLPLSSYMVENGVVDMIGEAGKTVIVHTVVTGGQAIADTLNGLNSLCVNLPSDARIIVWLNEFFGDIQAEGKTFEQMKVYGRHKDRIHGIVRIPRQTSQTFGVDIQKMLDKKLTFAEVKADNDFGIMSKQRLAQVQRVIFEQLDAVL
jgi:hypothetical protein